MMDFSARTLLMLALLACSGPVMKAQGMPIATGPPSTTADANAKLPQYDVASVKPNKSGERMMRIMSRPDGFSCTNLPLKTLIANAYGIRQDLISGGSGWMNSMGFDIDAKVSGEDMDAYKKLTGRQRSSLLQGLLADRFKLKIHHETKILTMYDLVVAKGGIKMKAEAAVAPSAGAAKGPEAAKPHGMMMMGPGELKAQGIPIGSIASNLSYTVHYTVTDKTGLSGNFDFDLKWTPDDAGPSSGDASDEPHVSIFTAVQEQLGLKLQPTKGPVDTLVIDHAEQPSEN
ncbi:MAG TPA: TIGR03435 family protein [Acidobacteriaceae bacterium]